MNWKQTLTAIAVTAVGVTVGLMLNDFVKTKLMKKA